MAEPKDKRKWANGSKERGNWIEQQQQQASKKVTWPHPQRKKPLTHLPPLSCHCCRIFFLGAFKTFAARPGKISSSARIFFPFFIHFVSHSIFFPPKKYLNPFTRSAELWRQARQLRPHKPAHFQRKSSSLSFTHVNLTNITVINSNKFHFNLIQLKLIHLNSNLIFR